MVIKYKTVIVITPIWDIKMYLDYFLLSQQLLDPEHFNWEQPDRELLKL